VRITSLGSYLIEDESNDDFTITDLRGALELTSPNGGELWFYGEGWEITWLANDDTESVDINISSFRATVSLTSSHPVKITTAVSCGTDSLDQSAKI